MGEDAASKPGLARTSMREYVRRVAVALLLALAFVGAALVLWQAMRVVLLFFAAILLAIFLRTLSDWVHRHTRLGENWSLLAVIVAIIAVFGLACWLLATPVSQQVDQMTRKLPEALARLRTSLEHYHWGQVLLRQTHEPTGLVSQAGGVLSKVRSVFSVTMEGVVDILVILFCGVYLAFQPQLYIDGFLKLLPTNERARGRSVLNAIGTNLRHWMFGQVSSMCIIGFLTWLGLHLLKIPFSRALGLLSGGLDFVPVVGPWVVGILSCLLALLKSPMHAVYVACLFLGLHLFEGHILIPQVQQHSTRLPPVLTILAIVLFTELFGFLGLLLATPLLALILVLVKTLALHDPDPTGKRE